jgi:type IV secretory pathway TrbD component
MIVDGNVFIVATIGIRIHRELYDNKLKCGDQRNIALLHVGKGNRVGL